MLRFQKVLSLVMMSVLAAGLWSGLATAEEKPAKLSVTGTGNAQAAPDMAIVSIGVLREADTARKALDANNKAMAEVLSAMREKGIEDRDLQTSGFNIQPRYVYPKNLSNGQQEPPRIVGYTVSNNLDIRIRKIEDTGEILDQLVMLGVNTGGNIRFTNDDPTEILTGARKSAVEDALRKARTLATTAGVGLGKILSISENSRVPRPLPIAQARVATLEAADAVPVAAGENSYSVTVSIVWEISQ